MTPHPHALSFDRGFLRPLIVAAVVANLAVLALYLVYGEDAMKAENGILETAQLVLLLCGALTFAVVAGRSRNDRIAATAAVGICFLGFFREFEVHGVHPAFEFMSSDPMLYVLGVTFAVWVGITLWSQKPQIPAFWAWVKRVEWWPLLIAGVLIFASQALEPIVTEFVEELLETNAYLIFATAGGAACAAATKRASMVDA